MTAAPRSRRKRILCWTTGVVASVCVLYVLSSYVASPFFETRLLGGRHPDLILRREVDPRHGLILTIRDDLPSTCDCPLHRMLAGLEVVDVGWSRFVGDTEGGMEKGGNRRIKFQGRDLAPERFILLSRPNDAELSVHLYEGWNLSWTLMQVRDRAAGLLRSVYR